jgi:PPK2 family polyphosphate:nucleotide phosphotransferase
MDLRQFIFPTDRSGTLTNFSTNFNADQKTKTYVKNLLEEYREVLSELQERLYAYDKYGLLIIFQAMDAAGKDGTIKHVMSGVNPQGCMVKSFKKPSEEELDHTYLWRCIKAMPERGQIGIFNRSYYEEVLITRVHPEIIRGQKLPELDGKEMIGEDFWMRRYEEINNLEKYYKNNGVEVLKFFLHISKEEQKKRFLKRIDDPRRNWKISLNDFSERQFWDDYQYAYEQMLRYTSTDIAPWYVIPADKKWFMRTLVSHFIIEKLKSMDLKFPEVNEKQHAEILQAKQWLEQENN